MLLLDVARRFYTASESKTIIAQDLGVSRFTVSRMLEQALALGLVRIDFRPPDDIDFDLSSALMRQTGVKRAIVLPTTDIGSQQQLLANAAASYLVEVGIADDVLGLVAGRTTSMILDRIADLPACKIVQLSGISQSSYFEHDPAETIRAMTTRSRGQTYPIYAPLLLDHANLVASLRDHIGIRDTFAQFPKLTRVLFSVGAWAQSTSGLYGIVGEQSQKDARDAGAVAEIVGHLLDADGNRVCADLSARCLTIPFELLSAVKDRVAVAGHHRATAVVACLRAGLITTLVTDSETARFVLSNFAG